MGLDFCRNTKSINPDPILMIIVGTGVGYGWGATCVQWGRGSIETNS
jgi:hypothetical protein